MLHRTAAALSPPLPRSARTDQGFDCPRIGPVQCRVPLDFSEADLLIVMGTSLVVNPFAGLIGMRGYVATSVASHLSGGLLIAMGAAPDPGAHL